MTCRAVGDMFVAETRLNSISVLDGLLYVETGGQDPVIADISETIGDIGDFITASATQNLGPARTVNFFDLTVVEVGNRVLAVDGGTYVNTATEVVTATISETLGDVTDEITASQPYTMYCDIWEPIDDILGFGEISTEIQADAEQPASRESCFPFVSG